MLKAETVERDLPLISPSPIDDIPDPAQPINWDLHRLRNVKLETMGTIHSYEPWVVSLCQTVEVPRRFLIQAYQGGVPDPDVYATRGYWPTLEQAREQFREFVGALLTSLAMLVFGGAI